MHFVLHGWELKFLVVQIIGLLTSVAFSVARKFFVQTDSLWAFSLGVSEGASIRLHSNIDLAMVRLWSPWLLAGRDHVATHVEGRVVGAGLGP